MRTEKLTKFEKKCLAVSGKVGVDVSFYKDHPDDADEFEDDGALHIRIKNGERAVFEIGQDLPAKDQNNLIKAVMDAMRLRLTDRVLVDEDDNEDDGDSKHCPTCCRPWDA